jgi:hypothetical protein
MQIDTNKFNEEGFVIIRNVFSEKEIAALRETVSETLEQDLKTDRAFLHKDKTKDVYYTVGDLLSKPLSKLLLDDRIIKIATEILGTEPTYFGESNYQVGIGDRGFHRDGVDRVYPVGQDWEEGYRIIRMGVYLQSHDKTSGGLKVQIGSNQKATGKKLILDVKAGDVVAWDLRTFHSGNAVRMKLLPNLPLGYRVENMLPPFLVKNSPVTRMSCFMVFGANNKHLDRHIEHHHKVKNQKHIDVSNWTEEKINLLKSKGVRLIDPK